MSGDELPEYCQAHVPLFHASLPAILLGSRNGFARFPEKIPQKQPLHYLPAAILANFYLNSLLHFIHWAGIQFRFLYLNFIFTFGERQIYYPPDIWFGV
jgi:hypothetical protein